MQADVIYREVFPQAFALLPKVMDSDKAKLMLLAIGFQESGFQVRDQLESNGKNTVLGPALGFWQFEKGGGVKGVLNHGSSRPYALDVCEALSVVPSASAVWEALDNDDVLAAAFARLLLWTDMGSLPKVGEVEKAWQYYERNWRPGKPHRNRWNSSYGHAMDVMRYAENPAV